MKLEYRTIFGHLVRRQFTSYPALIDAAWKRYQKERIPEVFAVKVLINPPKKQSRVSKIYFW